MRGSRILSGLHGGVARHQQNLQSLLLDFVVLLDRVLVLIEQVGLRCDGLGLLLLRRIGAHLDGGVCRLSRCVCANQIAGLGQLLNVLVPRLCVGAIGLAGSVLRCRQFAIVGRQVLRLLADGLQTLGIASRRLNIGVIAGRNPFQRGLESARQALRRLQPNSDIVQGFLSGLHLSNHARQSCQISYPRRTHGSDRILGDVSVFAGSRRRLV